MDDHVSSDLLVPHAKAGAAAAQRTSVLLRDLATHVVRKDVSVGWLLLRMRQRAYGLALILFSLPSCVPTPPGVSTVCGIVLAIVSVQMILGLQPLRLPRVVSRRRIPVEDVRRIAVRAAPLVERLERLARPRLSVMTGALGTRLVGLVVLVLSIVVMLPIPVLGNTPPAVATIVIALGLTERDGLVVFVGLAASVAALLFTGALAIEAVEWLIGRLTR